MKKLIGTKAFYKRLLALAVPIILQNMITNLVSLLDNIMVGKVGQDPMSGVAIVNQLIFVFNLLVFGALSGAGIFTAQFYGSGDDKGVRDTFRFKILLGIGIAIVTFVVLICAGEPLIRMYLTADTGTGDLDAIFRYGKQYLTIILWEIIPFIIAQVYASTLRETGQTFVPMMAGGAAVLVNLVGNYILIFGKFGAPQMGAAGAALATVISRVVECLIIVVWTHYKKEQNRFIVGAYRSLKVPMQIAIDITKKGTPLLANEVLWSMGIAFVNQCFSVRDVIVLPSVNISSTIANLFNVVFLAMGNTVAIMVGQQLGANEFEKAKDTSAKVIAFSVAVTILTGALMALFAGAFTSVYNVSGEVRDMAKTMILITACLTPLQAFLHATYFTIRSGGRTVITFLFDSGFSWCVAIPFVYCLIHFTSLPILVIFTLYYLLDAIKATVGFILLKKGIWLQNIVVE